MPAIDAPASSTEIDEHRAPPFRFLDRRPGGWHVSQESGPSTLVFASPDASRYLCGTSSCHQLPCPDPSRCLQRRSATRQLTPPFDAYFNSPHPSSPTAVCLSA